MLHIHTSPVQFNDAQNHHLNIAEKLAEGKNYETIGRLLNYLAISVSAAVVLVFTKQLAANYNLGVIKVAGDVLNTDIAPKALVGSALAGICGTYFTEQSKNLKDEARSILEIVDRRPVVITRNA